MEKSKLTKPLRILLATNALVVFAAAMLGPIYALFVSEIGGELLDASIAVGIFAIAAAVTTYFAGKYSDKIKENELIVIAGYIVQGVAFLLYTFVDSLFFLFAVQILIGFSEALYWPVYDAIYSKHGKNKLGKAWGSWEAMNYVTIAAGTLAGGLIVTYGSFDLLFVIMAVLCFASAIYMYFLPRDVL
ncbi:MFS transporter [Patescibacteria group bacterium]|nr:MFS transporter [Patescibacteria group bacterium]